MILKFVFSHVVKKEKRSTKLEDTLEWLVDAGISHKTIMDDSDLYKNFKGAFTENFVLNELIKQEIHPYFWRFGKRNMIYFLFEFEKQSKLSFD